MFLFLKVFSLKLFLFCSYFLWNSLTCYYFEAETTRYFNTILEESIKLNTPMEHPIRSQNLALTVLSLFFCKWIFKRNVNHHYFLFVNFPGSKCSSFVLIFLPILASLLLEIVEEQKLCCRKNGHRKILNDSQHFF